MVRAQLVGLLDGLKSGGLMEGHSWLEEAAAAAADEVRHCECLLATRGWPKQIQCIFHLGSAVYNVRHCRRSCCSTCCMASWRPLPVKAATIVDTALLGQKYTTILLRHSTTVSFPCC